MQIPNTTSWSYNVLGQVTSETNTQGKSATFVYDAFGNVISGGFSSPFMYCGEYLDIESGMYYLRARYYNPATGRFLTEAPIGYGLNWYNYCSGNPVMYVDSWGLYDVHSGNFFCTPAGMFLNDAYAKSDIFTFFLMMQVTRVDQPITVCQSKDGSIVGIFGYVDIN